MIIKNSLRYTSVIILDHSLIYTSKFLKGWIKGLIIDLYLLTKRKLFSALLICNINQSNTYHSPTLFLGLQ